MNPEVRDRVVLPLMIPLVAFLLVLIYILPVSRIFIAVGQIPAVVVAGAMALFILLGAAALAGAPRIRSTSLFGLAVLGALGLVAGGIAAMPFQEEGMATHGVVIDDDEVDVPDDVIRVTAADNEFDTDRIELPADEVVSIHFTHDDPEPHNIAIYTDETRDEQLFMGEIIDAGEEITYEVGPFEAGEYYFICSVHPFMDGWVVVE